MARDAMTNQSHPSWWRRPNHSECPL